MKSGKLPQVMSHESVSGRAEIEKKLGCEVKTRLQRFSCSFLLEAILAVTNIIQ